MRFAPAAASFVLASFASLAAGADAPAHSVGWAEGTAPQAPANFRVIAFARNLDGPRALLVLPNGDVLVAESRGAGGATAASANRVTLLRDSTGAGVADQRFALIGDLDRPSGLALRRDRLFIADTGALRVCPFLVGQTRLHGECHALAELPAAGGHDHWTRALALAPDETSLLVAVGSSGDADPDYRDTSDAERGTILSMRPDGKGRRVYASGLREAAALGFEPSRGQPYAIASERAAAADEPVADYFTRVADGAFFGWPYAYAGGGADPRGAGQHPELVARTAKPDVRLPPRSDPRSFAFYGRDHFPRGFRGGAFIALGGAPERVSADGFKVVHVPFADGRPSGPPADFLTGFIKDAAAGEVYARPAALAIATDGTLLVADDGGTLWRVIFKCAACTPDPVPAARDKRSAHAGR
jgi:glucose/arabinose dehydrogenase